VPSSRLAHPTRAAAVFAAVFAWLVAPNPPALAAARKIDVGGFRLNLRCDGDGSPVVILDAGAGDTLATWEWVTPSVRKLTRVCAYDRAGLGKSEPGPKPRTSARIVAELHELLVRGRVPPPYVLVGHSFGGLNVRLFASKYPGQVAGLVLVDATPEDYPEIEDSLHSPGEREKLRTSRAMAPQAFTDELDGMAESAASIRAAPLPPEMPVVVLTAAHAEDSPEFRTAWATLQRRMAGLFPSGRQVLAEQRDHYIQFDEPEGSSSAIRELIVRRAAPAASKRPPSGP
jgi:pimeloyl-ACP methyl ester carboxylesterase